MIYPAYYIINRTSTNRVRESACICESDRETERGRERKKKRERMRQRARERPDAAGYSGGRRSRACGRSTSGLCGKIS